MHPFDIETWLDQPVGMNPGINPDAWFDPRYVFERAFKVCTAVVSMKGMADASIHRDFWYRISAEMIWNDGTWFLSRYQWYSHILKISYLVISDDQKKQIPLMDSQISRVGHISSSSQVTETTMPISSSVSCNSSSSRDLSSKVKPSLPCNHIGCFTRQWREIIKRSSSSIHSCKRSTWVSIVWVKLANNWYLHLYLICFRLSCKTSSSVTFILFNSSMAR